MPTNLYGPGDNFDLEKSHVLPALLRKMYIGKILEGGNWPELRSHLQNIPLSGVEYDDPQQKIINCLAYHGIILKNGKVKIEIWGSGNPLREFLWS